jgi:pimeloyl-ACP methyl ester carboxylesterase
VSLRSPSPIPLRSLAGDAGYVRDIIAATEGAVVLVGHSYGGLVISEAPVGNDQVVGLVYVSAFVPEPGDRGRVEGGSRQPGGVRE